MQYDVTAGSGKTGEPQGSCKIKRIIDKRRDTWIKKYLEQYYSSDFLFETLQCGKFTLAQVAYNLKIGIPDYINHMGKKDS
jgi:hypothetical protein